MDNRKILIVYNTCGIHCDNTEWYIECLHSLINQDLDGCRVVLSSCLNSAKCIRQIKSVFGDRISYSLHSEPHTVNITLNKAVRSAVQEFGEFEGYLYVDSGCTFQDQTSLLSKTYEMFKSGDYGIITMQADSDEALQALDPKFVYQSKEIQITGEHYIIPPGYGINSHVNLYSNKLFKTFNNKLCPDVFAAFCTESVFSFLCAATRSRWAIMADYQVHHRHSLDGASSSKNHWSTLHNNTWNNLLYGRNALDFIHDEEALAAGMGYEECNNIMNHDPEAYNSNDEAVDPERLAKTLNKYVYLSDEELDYSSMKSLFWPQRELL